MDIGNGCPVNDPFYGAVHAVIFILIALARVNYTQVNSGGFWKPVDNIPCID